MKSTRFLLYTIACFICTSVQAQSPNVPDGSVFPPVTDSGPGAVSMPPDYYSTIPQFQFTLFNYSRRYVPLMPVKSIPAFDATKNMAVHVTTTYKDGFGMPLMTINRNGSSRDIITPYDLRTVGGLSVTYLSYPDTAHCKFRTQPFAGQGSYYLNRFPEEKVTAYSKTELTTENGIRVTKRYAPGLQNVGMQRGVTSSEHTCLNDELPALYYSNDQVCKWSVGYPANSLIITKEVDMHGAESIMYYDKSNRLLCKKVKDNNSSVGNTSGYLSTFYLYNELGKLMYIVPPKASALLASSYCMSQASTEELCFSFTYDVYGNVIEKKTPGKTGKEELIYDKNYVPVMSRNANMANVNQWAFTIYDKQGRAVISGLYTGTETATYWRDVVVGNTSPISRGVPQEETLEYWLKNYFTGTSYPQSLAGCEIHSYNYYDSYDNLPSGTPTSFDNSNASSFLTGPAMITPTPYMYVHGKLVASQTRILDSNIAHNFTNTPWITSVFFYDEEGRGIQTQTKNPWNTGDWDVSTVQFNFSGTPVLDISTFHLWQQSNKPLTTIMNKYTYGSLTGRLETVQQKIDTGAWQPISGYLYDEMGAVKVKWLGNVEEQIYSHDIRGRSTGVNADSVMQTGIVSNTKTFFEKLHYDHGYSQKRYDGSISGFMWRIRGHDPMSYGYEYDELHRLTDAEFRAFNGGGSPTWNNNTIDFTVSGIDYDMNGNMQHMNQRGFDQNMNPADIDQLEYFYDNGNNLMKVTDNGVPSATYIKDFDNGASGNNNDYQYDLNGNLKSDLNKDITDISYNHLDLPFTVTANAGTVKNIYTAAGTLLQKIIDDSSKIDTIRYWGPFVFKNDTLDYILQPEGRARYDSDSDRFTYDFFVKDHLGNVRTVVEGSSSYDQIEYHAGWEIIAANVEESLFEKIGWLRAINPDGTPIDLNSGKLNGTIATDRIGAAILVHTMAGDQFNLKGYGYYEEEQPDGYNMYTMETPMLNSLIDVFTGGASGGEGGEGGGAAIQTINNLLTSNNYTLYNNLKNSITNSAYPRAYLNYLVFNEQFELQPQHCQVVQLQGGANSWHLMELPTRMTMPVTGYLMAYLSNESPMDVWVDNEFLIHYESNLLEESHYYPHGLVIDAGNNSVQPKNDYLHQGKKLQHELGMELYDFHARQYDPQIGRFWGIDPADQFPSGYTGMGNDPANMIDPSGMYANDYSQAGENFDGGAQSRAWADIRRERDLMNDWYERNAGAQLSPKFEMPSISLLQSAGESSQPLESGLEVFLAYTSMLESAAEEGSSLNAGAAEATISQTDDVGKKDGVYEIAGLGIFVGKDGDLAKKAHEQYKKGHITKGGLATAIRSGRDDRACKGCSSMDGEGDGDEKLKITPPVKVAIHSTGPLLIQSGARVKGLKNVAALGSKKGSSYASAYLSKALPYTHKNIKRATRVFGNKGSTAVLGRALGRATPGIGFILTATDIYIYRKEIWEFTKEFHQSGQDFYKNNPTYEPR